MLEAFAGQKCRTRSMREAKFGALITMRSLLESCDDLLWSGGADVEELPRSLSPTPLHHA